jgi:hypothetical protein
LGNFTDSDVSVAIGIDLYDVRAKDSLEVIRESQTGTIEVEVWFKDIEPKLSTKREFKFEMDFVIRFCKLNGGVRFCEFEKLGPPPTFRLLP